MKKQNIKILIAGEGGQGIQTIAKIFSKACFNQEYKVCYMPHYGVEMRMGISMAYVQIGNSNIDYPKFLFADLLICMTSRDLQLTKSFCSKNTVVINMMNLHEYMESNELNIKSLNMIALGVLTRKFKEILSVNTEIVKNEIIKELGNKKGLENNIDAFLKGINIDAKFYNISLNVHPKAYLPEQVLENERRKYTHSPSHCKGCGLCIEKCPVKALSWSKKQVNYFGNPVPVVDIDKCISCGICVDICPDMAISIKKKD